MSSLVLPQEFPFDDSSLPYRIDLMHLPDLSQVMPIERLAFSAPWPASAYRYELTQNELSTYVVLRLRRSLATAGCAQITRLWRKDTAQPIVGYGGLWIILDEAHISTIAVHPHWRGYGLGEMTLVALIDAAILRAATQVTLEVRVSNQVAQNLYRKYAFVEVGRRVKYYHDNNEDALIMTIARVDDSAFLTRYADLKARLRGRLVQHPTRKASRTLTEARH
jgi:ribosomal-protein-alanine N-acetyltransferase